MSLQSSIVLLVAVASCATLFANGQQEVAPRSGSDDENGMADSEVGAGGQARNIYNYKHLSPHRMMHFGKRLLVHSTPEVITTRTQVLDLYPRPSQLMDLQQAQKRSAPGAPYVIYMPTRDRALESAVRNRQMMDAVQLLLEPSTRQQQQQQQQLWAGSDDDGQLRRQTARAPPKLMRLVFPSDESKETADNDEQIAKKQSSGDSQQAENGQSERQEASGTANGRSESEEMDQRANRSVRPLLPNLTRAHYNMLFGGQPSSNSQASSLLNFIKKAEPQRMTFMHFGRRR